MVRTIRNPLVWASDLVGDALDGMGEAEGRLRGSADATARIRAIGLADLRAALAQGGRDLAECRTDAVFAVLLYPIIGVLAVWVAFDRSLLPLVFPAAAGFALVGPVATIGVCEMTRRLEQGRPTSWMDGLRVLASPSIGAILIMGLALAVVFGLWMRAADAIYDATLGPLPPASAAAFAESVLTTGAGWAMIAAGFGVGFLFAALVLATTWLTFPILLDRDVGLARAVTISVRACARNPVPAAAWGLIVALVVAAGSLPLFLGLIVALPVLGHATWRLYRRTVAWDAP